MDNLFIEVFYGAARHACWSGRAQRWKALEQPLWAVWDLIRDQTNTGLNLEFLALGNHRKALQG